MGGIVSIDRWLFRAMMPVMILRGNHQVFENTPRKTEITVNYNFRYASKSTKKLKARS
jgi:hypothetical protein